MMKNFKRIFSCAPICAPTDLTTRTTACPFPGTTTRTATRTLLFAVAFFAAATFFSCKPEEPVVPNYTLQIVDFEDAELNESGNLHDESYVEKNLTFTNNYTSENDSWYGFAVSDNTDKETPGFANPYSVYGNGGYGGSKQFGLAYEAAYLGTDTCLCSFDKGTEYEIEYAWFNNSTWTYLSMRDGDDFSKQFADDDWFKLTVTGYDAAGTKTGTVDVYLADFQAGKSFIMSDWTKVSLLPLGKVNRLVFNFTSTDNGEWGINTPTYVCIDNVAYRKYLPIE